jgi:WD40 repeat protein
VEEGQELADTPTISFWRAPNASPLETRWDREIWSLQTLHAQIAEQGFAMSPDGGFVMVTLGDGARSIIDIQARKPVRSLTPGESGSIVALGPGARLMASAVQRDRTSSLALVDPSGREPSRTVSHAGEITALGFSGDGRHLALAVKGEDGRSVLVRLTVNGMKETARLEAGDAVTAVAMNGDGTLMAVAGAEALNFTSAVSVWRVPLPRLFGFLGPAGPPVLNHRVRAAEGIEHISLTYDGGRLVTASMPLAGVGPHLVLEQWTLAPDALAREACRRIGRDMTAKQWEMYVPGERPRPTCPKS